ncbi:MAG: hypothetical protein L0Z62_35830, partial [Gemmataceae bacterium]|nr:hypothetical protein [Gemmataceae bacterium]
ASDGEPDAPTLTPPLLDALLAGAALSRRALGMEPARLAVPFWESPLRGALAPAAIEPDALALAERDRQDASPLLPPSARSRVSTPTALGDAVARLFAEDGFEGLAEPRGAEALPVWVG